jgi:hypothetical protein
MRKTMVYLNEDQYYILNQIAKQSNRKMAELIREAVDILIKEKNRDRNYFRFVGIGSGDINGKTSENVDEIMREVFK